MGERWCHCRYLGSDEVSGFMIWFRFILPRSKPDRVVRGSKHRQLVPRRGRNKKKK